MPFVRPLVRCAVLAALFLACTNSQSVGVAPAADEAPAASVEAVPEAGGFNMHGVPAHDCCETAGACCSTPGCCDLAAPRGQGCRSLTCPALGAKKP